VLFDIFLALIDSERWSAKAVILLWRRQKI